MAEKDILSQEEIDALLHSTDNDSAEECLDEASFSDEEVSITVAIGCTKMSIRDLLQLNQGSVIVLDHLTGQALDVLVNDKLLAKGEILVVQDKIAVRLTDIASKDERIKLVSSKA